MATVKSLIRTANASYRRSVRDDQKKYNETNIEQQQQLKQQIKGSNPAAIVTYNKYIDSLLSVHEESSETLSWEYYTREPEPSLPARKSTNQDAAESIFKAFKPSFLTKIFGQSRKRLNELSKQIDAAKQVDDLVYNRTLKEFKADLQDWIKIQNIAKGIKEADPVAYKLAIDFFEPFAKISQFGSQLKFEIFSDQIIVNIYVNQVDIIPDYVINETGSGNLSIETMNSIAYHELCQDYICSSVLRVARETFALLPVKNALVNVFARFKNEISGHQENKAILSVNFNPAGLRMLHFKALDCPASLINFPYHMSFSKTGGMLPVELLSRDNYLLSLK